MWQVKALDHGDRATCREGFQASESIDVLFDEVGELQHRRSALSAGKCLPWSCFDGGFGAVHCRVDVCAVGDMNVLGYDRFIPWVGQYDAFGTL